MGSHQCAGRVWAGLGSGEGEAVEKEIGCWWWYMARRRQPAWLEQRHQLSTLLCCMRISMVPAAGEKGLGITSRGEGAARLGDGAVAAAAVRWERRGQTGAEQAAVWVAERSALASCCKSRKTCSYLWTAAACSPWMARVGVLLAAAAACRRAVARAAASPASTCLAAALPRAAAALEGLPLPKNCSR